MRPPVRIRLWRYADGDVKLSTSGCAVDRGRRKLWATTSHHRVPVFAEFLYSVRLDNSRKPTRLHNIDVAQSIPSPYARLMSLCRERKSVLKGGGWMMEGNVPFGIEFHAKFNFAL